MTRILRLLSVAMFAVVVAGAGETRASAQTPATTAVPTSASNVDVKAIAPGDGTLDGTRVLPGKTVFAMNGAMNGETLDLGTMTEEMSRIDVGGKTVLRFIETSVSAMGTSVDTSIAVLQTLQPISLHGNNPGGTLVIDFDGATVTGQRRDNSGNTEPIKQKLAQSTFDANIIDALIAALPLQANYAVKLPVFIFEQSGLGWCTIRVTGESMRDGVAVWNVAAEMPDGVAHYAISKADHTNMGAEFDAPTGMRITMTRKNK